ncbi:phage minor head protein [Acinetobacter guillouiae]|uniref:phage head morphogenesis protein n=1 Tax=Acinetobacter guillouiae TaxID=106649 RepID=UPI0028D587F7|nr:phage minor head protein [Acinetobacter guillouiae]
MSSFQVKFEEQIDYLKQKTNLPTQSYKDITSRQHDRAFVVAGAMKADLLNDLHNAVNKAVADGQSFQQFQDSFDDIIGKHGWLNDEDDKYKAWRAKMIYQTNLKTSHAAGRYQQMTSPEMVKLRPYWRYRHNTIENPRIQHEKWNNLVLPVDAAFWRVNFPPNGYGCNCTIEAINERQLRAMGKTKPDTEPAFDDGERSDFNSAPGAAWFPDLNKYPEPIAKEFVKETMQDGVFDRFVEDTFEAVELIKITAKVVNTKLVKTAEIKKQLKNITTTEQYPVAVLNTKQQELLGITTQTLLFKQADAVQQIYQSATGLVGNDLQKLFDNAFLIVRASTSRIVVAVTLTRRNFIAEIEQSNDGLFLKSLNTASPAEIKQAKTAGSVLFNKE